tara:strand:- start:856 stop:1431 length:576 start_codon:yes stop_codon:yes gene_type:complete
MTSCQEAKNNKSKEIEIVSEENEISPIDSTKPLSSKNIVDTLDLQNLITNKIDSILPTPDSTFFGDTDTSTSVAFIINKYINSNFFVTKTTKVLETTSADHPEGVFDCHTRTEYGNIAIEERTCELQLEKTVEFKNYSFKEVCRIIKILFTKKSDNGEGWHEGEYIYGDGMCSLSIIEGKDKIIVTYGCSC